MDYIFNNLDLILAAAVVIIAAVVLARRGQIALLRELILSLVIGAEGQFGAGTGELKKSDVTAKIYAMLPSLSKLMISGSTVSKLIEEAKSEMDGLVETKSAYSDMLTK